MRVPSDEAKSKSGENQACRLPLSRMGGDAALSSLFIIVCEQRRCLPHTPTHRSPRHPRRSVPVLTAFAEPRLFFQVVQEL